MNYCMYVCYWWAPCNSDCFHCFYNIYFKKKAPEGQYPCKSIQLVEMKKHIKETGFLS